MTGLNDTFDHEARALCERQNLAFHDWQKSERAADTIFVRGLQGNREKVEVWAIEFRPVLADPGKIEVKRSECVLVGFVGHEQPDPIIEETHAYNRWSELAPEFYKSTEDYNG